MCASLFTAYSLQVRIWDRRGQHESLRVGMIRGCRDVRGFALLDDVPLEHDRDTMTDMTDHVEVMGDEQVRHARLLLDLQQQIEDASLMGYPKPYEPITFQIPACRWLAIANCADKMICASNAAQGQPGG